MSQNKPKRHKTRVTIARTLLVLSAFAILLAYMLLIEARRAPTPDPEATPTPQPILSWETDELRSIQVTDGSAVTRVERVGTEWHVVAPQEAAADPRTIYWPLLELAGIEARLLVSEKVEDKATYGLDSPSLTIAVETRSGETARLYAGRETPDGTAFYVQREGDPRLYVVDHFKIEILQEWLSSPPYKTTPTPGR